MKIKWIGKYDGNNLPTVDNNVASDFFDSIIDKFRSII